MTHQTNPGQAMPAVQVAPHVVAMGQLQTLARLAEAMQAADHKLCWAIKNSRDCGLSELTQGLLGLQAQFDDLVARLQPALLFKPEQSV